MYSNAAEVESERAPREDAHFVSHHTHLVQRWLSVEDDRVAVDDVSLHFVADLEMQIARLLDVSQINDTTVVANDGLGAGVDVGSVLDQLAHAADVEARHDLGVRHVQRDRARNTKLINALERRD